MKNDYTVNVVCKELGYNADNNVVMYCPTIPNVGDSIVIQYKGHPVKTKVIQRAFSTIDHQVGTSGKFIQVNIVMVICSLFN